MNPIEILFIIAVIAVVVTIIVRRRSPKGQARITSLNAATTANETRLREQGVHVIGESRASKHFRGAVAAIAIAFALIFFRSFGNASPSDWLIIAFSISFALLVGFFIAWIGRLIANAAQNKGRSWLAFFWLSILVSPIIMGIIVAVLPALPGTAQTAPPRSATNVAQVQCAFCKESVRADAVVCKHCGRDIEAQLTV